MLQADPQRMLKDIQTLAALSSTPAEQGITRISWTREYAQGADYIKGRMQQAGLEVREDEAGNLGGLLRGQDPDLAPIVSGSHLDTVWYAGAYDGVLGVAAALECARILRENHIQLRRDYLVVGMVEEESSRTGRVLTGSSWICAQLQGLPLPRIQSLEGERFEKMLADYRAWQQIQTPPAPLLSRTPLAFLEVHDEQGPVLEQRGIALGVVEQIRGILNLEVSLTGASGHPGTVPMSARHDPSLAAYQVCLDADRYVRTHYGDCATITFGKMEIRPGSSNSIPGQAVFSVDIRFDREEAGKEIQSYLRSRLEKCAGSQGLELSVQLRTEKAPVSMDSRLCALLQRACREEGCSPLLMSSGAGHDSMNFAPLCPTAMLFTPCRGGISHNAAEYVAPEHMALAAQVLCQTILLLDKECFGWTSKR